MPPGLCDAIPVVLKEAHAFLLRQTGNPSEAAKRSDCWEDFRQRNIRLNETWERELAAAPFITVSTDGELLAAEWERLRHPHTTDVRTMEALEAYTGKSWVKSKRRELVSSYASLTWEQLLMRPRVGRKAARELVEMFAAAQS